MINAVSTFIHVSTNILTIRHVKPISNYHVSHIVRPPPFCQRGWLEPLYIYIYIYIQKAGSVRAYIDLVGIFKQLACIINDQIAVKNLAFKF